MIKLEITDPHLMDKKALQETAIYLMALTGGKLVIPEPHHHQHPLAEDLAKYVADKPSMTLKSPEEYEQQVGRVDKKPYVAPALLPLTVEDQLDMHQLAGTDPLDIDEEFIPVPPEVVNIPAPPSPAEIFMNSPAVAKSSVELDIQGMPWDLRIHARTKTKMKDGSWKKLRGIGPDVVKRVEAELKTVQNIPAPPPSVPVPAAPVTAAAVIPAAIAVPGFSDLMTLVTKSITEGKLKRDQVVEVLKPFGIASLPLVSTRLDLIPAIMLALEVKINESC